MTTKTKAPPRAAGVKAPSPRGAAFLCPKLTPPETLEERLRRIEAMGQRIDEYVRFMCQVATLNGASVEAKERAVTAFYERMVVLESQLGRIHEDLRLE
jgi:hypothetical protein